MNRPAHPAVIFAMTATGLAAARSLSRRGVAVYGVDAKRWEVGHHSAEVRRPPFAYEPLGAELAGTVAAWAREQPAPPVLIPADDPACEFLSTHHELLRPSCLLSPSYRPEMVPLLVDKRTFYRRCLELGVELPRTVFLDDQADDVSRQLAELRFPVVLKPAHGYRWRKRLHGAKVLEVGSRDELHRALDQLGEGVQTLTVQEVVPGPEREIFVCGAYFRADGTPQAVFTARKSRQYPPRFGSGSLLVSEWHEGVARLSLELIARLGYRGICGTEYKPDPRDGRFKLIEVNPRPTLWFSLCRAAGCDVVDHAYRDLIGQPLAPQIGRQRDGVRWQYFLRDLLSLGRYLREGSAGGREVLEALNPFHKDEAISSLRDVQATLYYPLYGYRQWRAHARGDDTGP